jgi:hypothetical protein
MSDGFLGRWSRRKLEAKEGKPVADDPPPLAEPTIATATTDEHAIVIPAAAFANDLTRAAESQRAEASATTDGPAAEAQVPAAVPPPTMEDVKSLTAQSDFSRFATREVAPEVKNAALKKLFTDPRYNVMDGMDVYVDDYSKPDPMPPQMLRQLAAAAAMHFFDEPPTDEHAAAGHRDVADNPTAQTVAQSGSEPPAVPDQSDHDDPDLRLQQNDATPGAEHGDGAA